VSWREVVVAILKLVDSDSICDFGGQGIPLVDHPVCECVGPLQTFSIRLSRQSPRMPSDASGGAGLREWAAVDRGFTQFTSLMPLTSLNSWIRSPRRRRSWREVNPRAARRSSKRQFLMRGTSLVALLCTFSSNLASFLLRGDQTTAAYSRWGLT